MNSISQFKSHSPPQRKAEKRKIMSTPAVTPEAPAVSTASPERQTVRQSEHASIPSTDKHYRLTGEMAEPPAKEETPEPQVPPVKEGESATPNASETAAGSEPAKPAQKTAATSENRWAKITRENRELRERPI